MNISLSGKVALVTGASRGLGRAICLALGKAGAKVAVTDLLVEDETVDINELKDYGAVTEHFAKADQVRTQSTAIEIQQMGSQSNNSIWDSNVLSRLIDQTTSKEETEQQKGRIDKLRNSLRDGRIDEMVDAIKSTETRKESTVSQTGNYFESSKYKEPQNSIGIFDNNEFSNVPEQTHGEKVAMEARQPKEKDDSWKDIRGTSKVKSTLDTFFDTLTKE